MKIRVLLAAGLMVLLSGAAWALGLGEIVVNSRLNQPLNAEIAVREAFPGEAEQLVARLASPEDFARVGLERARMPVTPRFETARNDRGQTVIRIRSDEPVREPFLTLLVEANWSGGRLLREYGVLLDPPVAAPASTIARAEPAAAAAPAAAPEPPAAATQPLAEAPSGPAPAQAAVPEPVQAPAPQPAPAPAAPAAQPSAPATAPPTGFAAPAQARPAAPAAPAIDESAYTVQRGDTLGAIAARYAASQGVATNQMMVALQRENPRAFFADNINALKAGAVLRVPDADQVRAVSAREAGAAVRAQNQAWAGTTALADAGAAPRRSSVPSLPTTVDDRLAIVPARGEGGDSESAGRAGSEQGAAQMAQVESELQRTREDLRSKDQELSELASRIRDLEELNARNARLLELKDAEVAELQRRLSDAAQAAEAAVPVAEAQPPQEPAPELPVDTVAATAPDEVMESGVEAAAEAPVAPVEAGLAGDEAADVTADATGEADVAALDEAMDEAAQAATEQPGADEDAGALAGAEDAAAAADVEVAALEPEAAADQQPAPPVEAAPAEPLPVATAEVPAEPMPARPWYMDPMVQGAIGLGVLALLLLAVLAGRQRRTAQAKTETEPPRRSVADLFGQEASAAAVPATAAAGAAVAAADDLESEVRDLEEQVAAEPDDFEAHLELLSIHYAEGDRLRFEEAAERFHARPGAPASAEWAQALDMGSELAPGHPLFVAAVDGRPDAAADADADTFSDEGWEQAPPPPPAAPAEPVLPRVRDIGGTEFLPDPDQVEEVIPPEAPPIDFEPTRVGAPAPEAAPPPAMADAEPAADSDGDGHDALPPLVFSDTFETVDTVTSEPGLTFEEDATMDASVSADEGAGMDEAATKLELARAYLDMGDPEGARAMLEEVLGEGDTSQREEARKLLATL